MRKITRLFLTGMMLVVFSGMLNLPGAKPRIVKLSPAPAQAQTSKVQPPISETGRIRDFNLLTPNSGWLLLAQQLFMTHDEGGAWTAITPPGATRLWAVDFLDERQGWAVTSTQPDSRLSAFDIQLWTTSDGGLTWQNAALPVDPFPGLTGVPPEQVYLSFFDPLTGWIVFQQPTTSNFSLGRLFRTQDGGLTWQPLAIPIAAPVFFVDPQTGYTQGGATGEERYTTLDGGASWAAVKELPPQAATYFERFSHSLLNNQPGAPALQTAMLDSSNGWALETTGECATDQPKSARACTQTQQLLHTLDGGESWAQVNLPGEIGSTLTIALPAPSDLTPITPNPDLQSLFPNSVSTGHAFDKCEVASLAQLQEWWDKSPYAAVNL